MIKINNQLFEYATNIKISYFIETLEFNEIYNVSLKHVYFCFDNIKIVNFDRDTHCVVIINPFENVNDLRLSYKGSPNYYYIESPFVFGSIYLYRDHLFVVLNNLECLCYDFLKQVNFLDI